MTCQTCKNLQSGPMTKLGYNACKVSPRWEGFALTYHCDKHAQEAPDVLAKRIAWLESKGVRK